jgi:hypothetical protein
MSYYVPLVTAIEDTTQKKVDLNNIVVLFLGFYSPIKHIMRLELS